MTDFEARAITEKFILKCRAKYFPKPNFVVCLVYFPKCGQCKEFLSSLKLCNHSLKYEICRRTVAENDRVKYYNTLKMDG